MRVVFALAFVFAVAPTVSATVCRQRVIHGHHDAVVVAPVLAVQAYGAAYDPGTGELAGQVKKLADSVERLERLLGQMLQGQPQPQALKQQKPEPQTADQQVLAAYVAALTKGGCVQCHADGTAKGGLTLMRDGKPAAISEVQAWRVTDRTCDVKAEDRMPPAKSKIEPWDDKDFGAWLTVRRLIVKQ